MKAPLPARAEQVDMAAKLLQKSGFYVADVHTVRPSCFDLIARRDSELVLLKILKNVDAVGERGASSLISLARMMGGSPILLGLTSGDQDLEEGVIYNRYGLTILTLKTLEDFLLHGIYPFLLSSPGGIFARINGRRLREVRERSHQSLGAVAETVGVSRRTIQLYEDGAGADVDVIEKLESLFGVQLATPLDPFERGLFLRHREDVGEEQVTEDRVPQSAERWMGGVISTLGGQGWRVEIALRSPIDVLARHGGVNNRGLVVMGVGDLATAERRAKWLHDIAKVAESWSVFIVPERRDTENIEGTAIMALSELKRHRTPESLFEILEERTDG